MSNERLTAERARKVLQEEFEGLSAVEFRIRLDKAVPAWAKPEEKRMDEEDEALDELRKALNEYFGDTSRTQKQTLEGLQYLMDEIVLLVECLEKEV